MINEVTSRTHPADYARVVDYCRRKGYRIPDSPGRIAKRERFDRQTKEVARDLVMMTRILDSFTLALRSHFARSWWQASSPAKVRQAMGAVTANPLGEVRDGITEYQGRCNAERDSWLVDLERRAS